MRTSFWGLIAAALLFFCACSTEFQEKTINTPQVGETITITAYSDSPVRTKTGVIDNGNGGKSVVWKAGNAISLFFNQGDNGGNRFTTNTNGPIAEFTGTISAVSGDLSGVGGSAFFWGLYPYNANAACDGSTITTTLPASQLAYQGDVADDLLVTVGRSENLAIHFKNTCAIIGFTLSQENITKVTFTGNNEEYVAGEFMASFDGSNNLTITPTANAVKAIEITPAESSTFATGTTYYFAILPQNFESGYKLTFTRDDDYTATYERTSAFNFTISTFYTMTNKDSGLAFVIPEVVYKDYIGDISFRTEEDLNTFYEGGFTRIIGNVTIGGSIRTLSNLDNQLISIQGDLIINCPSLTTLDGLYGLKNIEGDLNVKNQRLTNFEGLNNLERIGGNLLVDEVSSLSGLGMLSTIGGGVRLTNVGTMQELSNITTLSFLNVTGATSLEGLNSIERVEGNVYFENGKFESFDGINNLQYIGGDLNIYAKSGYYENYSPAFPNLSSLSGFDNLSVIEGNLDIFASASASSSYSGAAFISLTNLSGLSALQRIGGSLKIRAYYGENAYHSGRCFDNLESIDIPSLKEIGKDLLISSDSYYGKPLIKDLSFSSLESIGGDIVSIINTHDGQEKGWINKGPSKLIRVKGINAICSFEQESDGFVSLTTISSLEASGFGFPNLTTITGDWIVSDGNKIGEMNKLTTIGGDLVIQSTSLSSIDCLNSLTTIGNELTISNNLNLSSISGFMNLSSVTSITIINQPSLYDFSTFVSAVNNGASWYCTGCGYNPTKYQMLHGQANGE